MTECEAVQGLLVDYVNRRLAKEQIGRVIMHLANCAACRSELAAVIRLKKLAEQTMQDVPSDILKTAFEKIPKQECAFNGMLTSNPYSIAFELLDYALAPVKQTLMLVRQII